ncbi:MAG: aldehyde ferredoxin oxidoreductase family protein [Anaerolineales bacterium]|nr:aldehyde ferredoxin oxidoreductase family protein [Anaerolineales bacterium]MDW8447172.1 aldehyde ferredoxin oxidoreductase family protein [Anaerolineales bacterium]
MLVYKADTLPLPRAEFLNGQSAYTGLVLHVDLTTPRCWVESPPEAFYRRFVGGRNFILHYLLTQTPPRIDPLGPQNLLIFAAGVLSGTVLPGTGRHAIGAKSPLTGALASSEAGGWWGSELKRAGYDAVVIHGRAAEPVYLLIRDREVELHSAKHLWGKTTADTQDALREAVGDEKLRVACIGPAGENLVRYASVMHDVSRAAGRSGIGAVMGSKNLKAVAVRGSLPVGLENKSLMQTVQKWINVHYKTDMAWAIQYGTAGSALGNVLTGATAIRNYTRGLLSGADQLEPEQLFRLLVRDRDTCNKCPVRCKLVVGYEDEETPIDTRYGGLEYESIASLGPLCDISDPVVIAKANELCNAYGLDSISTGGTIAFAMEALEQGALPLEWREIAPRFGDGESLIRAIHQIAHREGPGDWMAEGSQRLADRLGGRAHEWLATGRGQELPMHDPRLKQTMAMGYALSATGADHMHNYNDSFATAEEGDICSRLKEVGLPVPMPLWGISELKIEAFYYETAFKNFYDCAVICHFYPYLYQHMVEALSAASGWDVTLDEINRIGLRAITLGRLYLLREGFTAQDDRLSARAFYKLSEGPIANRALTPEEMRCWLGVYYRRMGWDEQGIPSRQAVEQLELLDYMKEN